MRLGRHLLILGTLAVLLFPHSASAKELTKAQADMVRKIEYQLRCVMCQGESIAESPSHIAQTMRKQVQKLVKEGKKEPEVLDYFSARYGEFVLMEPKKHPRNWPLWFGPGFFVLLGSVWLVYLFKKKSTGANETAGETANASPPPTTLTKAQELLEKGET